MAMLVYQRVLNVVNNDILAGWVWGSSGVVRALVLLRRLEALRGLRIAAHLLKCTVVIPTQNGNLQLIFPLKIVIFHSLPEGNHVEKHEKTNSGWWLSHPSEK